MSRAQKFMGSRRGNKVPVKKSVMRGGKSFQQTFWVSPQEAKSLQRRHRLQKPVDELKARREEASKVKKAPVKQLTESVSRQRDEKHVEQVADLVISGDFDEVRREYEEHFRRQGFHSHEYDTHKVSILDDLPDGVQGAHNQTTGEIQFSRKAMGKARRFLKMVNRESVRAAFADFERVHKINAEFRKLNPEWPELEEAWELQADGWAPRADFGLPDAVPPGDSHPARRFMRTVIGFHTIVHESLHGFGPTSGRDYTGHGIIVEEVTTEVLARSYMKERFDLPQGLIDSHDSAYQEYVGPLQQVLTIAYGDQDRAIKMLEDIARKFKKRAPADDKRVGVAQQFIELLQKELPPTGNPYLDEEDFDDPDRLEGVSKLVGKIGYAIHGMGLHYQDTYMEQHREAAIRTE